MKAQPIRIRHSAVGTQASAGADSRRPEAAIGRRDRRPLPELRPTVYCPRERVQQCVTESR
jgi:hypothetical protein